MSLVIRASSWFTKRYLKVTDWGVDFMETAAVGGRRMVILIERMSLPLNSPDGQIMSYKLHHKRTGQQLLDRQTLTEAGVLAGDDLRLQPEITAGAPAAHRPFVSSRDLR